MDFETFKREHFGQFTPMKQDIDVVKNISKSRLDTLETEGLTWTLMHEGKPVGVFGVIEFWEGRAELWSVIGVGSKRVFVALQRAVKKKIMESSYTRIELVADKSFEPTRRWAKSLGFEVECETMTAYYPGKQDCTMYTLIRGV